MSSAPVNLVHRRPSPLSGNNDTEQERAWTGSDADAAKQELSNWASIAGKGTERIKEDESEPVEMEAGNDGWSLEELMEQLEQQAESDDLGRDIKMLQTLMQRTCVEWKRRGRDIACLRAANDALQQENAQLRDQWERLKAATEERLQQDGQNGPWQQLLNYLSIDDDDSADDANDKDDSNQFEEINESSDADNALEATQTEEDETSAAGELSVETEASSPVVLAKVVPLLSITAAVPAVAKASSTLSVTVEPKKKVMQEPRHQRGSATSSASSSSRTPRLKFQFQEAELDEFMKNSNDDYSVAQALAAELSSKSSGVSSQSPLRSPAGLAQRRYSSAGVIATTVPLRRKSFTMKKTPGKSSMQAPMSAPTPLAPSSCLAARRKSTSACISLPRGSSKNNGLRWNLAMPPKPSASVVLAPSAGAASQMVLRVRGRRTSGVPELVISKKPANCLVWHYQNHEIRIPFTIQLGPHQHSVMLRQLRYVKSVMHDFPWAKAHLRELLSSYTKKDITKEELYPQLNQLSNHVQHELADKMKKQKQLVARKHHLTLQLTIASGVLNELQLIKFGRRGKPHETKLIYDVGDPAKLFWQRKSGDKSEDCMDLDAVEVIEGGEPRASTVLKKAAKKYPLDPSCCVSLVTPERSLDLQAKSAVHRAWLVNALKDAILFAHQYKAAGKKAAAAAAAPRTLRRM
ncbi:TPA: hypothetical protein N0F65_009934 [Lagenidium giganteum]|uniref:Uncharacterized protein n=1 Tax=Lagenidium giganteum TaxID=4803 RepID=A0AAV2YHH5_9STRA|nr:TPA: hypothetical protein N0F65_009934 [Lagenidium giganteum]